MGYGSQALALKYLGVEFEHWKICEWAVKSIQAYKDIHCFYDETYPPILESQTKEEMVDYLYKKGISSNYNEPMTKQQIERLSEEQLRNVLNNIYQTHNLVNIQQVKGKDLKIADTDKYDYILTYSFPCQDLSLAGTRKLMSDTSTRSGMLWEVERILSECKQLGTLPQILLMENVIQVHGEGAKEDFNRWQLRLEELGYKNYWQDLIATDYGIPQTRNRTFMVSILGDYNYTFPKSTPLKLKLKDMLEDNVDEKYYLSDKTLEQISNWKSYQNPLDSVMGKESISPTITTRIAESQDGGINASMKVYCDELNKTTNLRIKNATAKGYLEATDEIINTYDEYNHKINGTETIGTIQAMYSTPNHGHRLITNDLKIRKLTPRECFRLMGVKDKDFNKVAKSQSDSSLYHLAGDSICVPCLMALFSQLLDIKWEDKI